MIIRSHILIFILYSRIFSILADSGTFYISSVRTETGSCQYDRNKCKHGTCRGTKDKNGRDFLCACPPKKTGPLCEREAGDCLDCIAKARKDCTGLGDGTAVCICLEFKRNKYKAPSVCYFRRRLKSRQSDCNRHKHSCTPGQECVDYARGGSRSAKVCQCPVGNIRGPDSCEQDYEFISPGNTTSCVEANKYGPICMCKKYGRKKNEYGFCKAKLSHPNLFGTMNEGGPCSLSQNKCRHGQCIQIDKEKFICACYGRWRGKYCHIKTIWCDKCKKDQRFECLGLEDETVVCICESYYKNRFNAPSLCFLPDPHKKRQGPCKLGRNPCKPGKECVNYALSDDKPQVLCQCPVGRTRGVDCIEDYKFMDIAKSNVQPTCIYSDKYGPFCMCKVYGRRGKNFGFCKPRLTVHGAVVKPKGSGGPCDASINRCRRGTCIETEEYKGFNYICACPAGYSGRLCHHVMIECYHCKDAARKDCIGLPDGTAVCICVDLVKKKRRYGKTPMICYYKRFLAKWQSKCRPGRYECPSGRHCINYSQYSNRNWMTCQCLAGKKRGKHCSDDYKVDRPSGRNYCVDTVLYGPICMCDRYRGRELGFCVPQLHKSAGYRLVQNAYTALLKTSSPCKAQDLCNGGICIEEKGQKRSHFDFLCACPVGKTGKLCHHVMLECYHCKDEEREDCIGFPDGTAVCICLELEDRKKPLGDPPFICYYKMFKDSEQKRCQKGTYKCPKGKQCVNYAQFKNRDWMACHCPAGKKRGDHCDEDYKMDKPSGRYHCVDTVLYGPICMCGRYRKRKYGFCIPQVADAAGYNLIQNGHTALIKAGTVCGANRNKCKEGTCLELPSKQKPNFAFICSCPTGRTGKLCQQEMLECYHCKDPARRDCLGLPDGTGICICLELENRKKHLGYPPLICYYKRFQESEQTRCKNGRHDCVRGKQCVDYAQYSNRPWVACQCQAGEKRGPHCEDDYLMDRPVGRSYCVDTLLYGPLCMCDRYGDFGFCVPQVKQLPGMKTDKNAHITAAKIVSPCEASKNLCKKGICMEEKSDDIPNFSFICSCPVGRTGKFCHEEMLECYHCKDEARRDCMGLPDGTGACICLELENRKKKLGTPPLICYYKTFYLHWQRRCQPGRYECPAGRRCVNYAQYKNRDWMNCECLAGRKRGEHCDKDYRIDRPSGKFSCVDTLLYGPICMCNKYSHGQYGFCIPELTKAAGYTLIQTGITALIKYSSPCASGRDICNGGKCLEEPSKHKPSFDFICACPAGKTGKLCQREMLECYHCKDPARRDCMGLPDGTAVCICLELENRKKHRGKPPLICYYKQFKQTKQGRCREGRHNCPRGKDCVNYAQYDNRPWMACECLAGKKRGKHCRDEYVMAKAGKYYCVDTLRYGPICMCDKYGRDRYGFCKPKLKKKTDSACGSHLNICREGKCIDVKSQKEKMKFICSCPFGKTGNLCNRDMPECSDCRESALTDCISLPDGTAVCVCVELKKEMIAEEPAICYFNKAKDHEQKFCHGCSSSEKCVIYGGTSTCQCPAGGKRGRKCKKEYKRVNDPKSCVDTNRYGPLCVCGSYGGAFSKFGFCKPNMRKKKRSKRRRKREVPMKIASSERIQRKVSSMKYSAALNRNDLQTYDPALTPQHRVVRSARRGTPCNCRTGVCIREESGFICACPPGRTGRLCDQEMLECYHCKDPARRDCMGLPDGRAVCICLALENRKRHLGKPPLICYYKMYQENEQSTCKRRKYKCPQGKKCVNYAQFKNRPWVACQCEAGKKRGPNCKDDYVEDTPGGRFYCVDTMIYGLICMCTEYTGREKYGFCIPRVAKSSGYKLIKGDHTALVKPGTVCKLHDNICNGGTCIDMPGKSNPSFSFICSCPLGKIGNLCQREMLECYHCKDRGRNDCIGLPGGTGLCVCLKLENRKRYLGQPPLICYYKMLIETWQGRCSSGRHKCPTGRQCVNYAQYKNRNWMNCECLAGKKRGRNCNEDYVIHTPSGKANCVDTFLYGPVCLCGEYGRPKYGLCVPQLPKSTGYNLFKNDVYTALVKSASPCVSYRNICNGGKCIDLQSREKPNFAFICACPTGKTGKLCQRVMLECYHCKDRGRRDCIGLPDGTGLCVCLELENRKRHLGKPPLTCYYKTFKKNEQSTCKKSKYKCSRGKKCINYAQYRNRPWVACQCEAGKLRGPSCDQDYVEDVPSGRIFCVDTLLYGPICMCSKYSGRDKYGFCIPKVAKTAGLKVVQSDMTALVKQGSVCDTNPSICNGGTCINVSRKQNPYFSFICSCPVGKIGKFCQKEMLECYHCRDKGRNDCIGLPDGTGLCVCLELEKRKRHLGKPPLICYYKKFIETWQGRCTSGRHKCPSGRRCVNYAQFKNRNWMNCECLAGKKRGKNCDRDYKVDRPAGDTNCVDTVLYGPVCLCEEYDRPKHGLCIPDLPESSGYKLVQNAEQTALMKSGGGSQCVSNPNVCNGGKCMEEIKDGKDSFSFICSCPVGKTGKLCEREMLECYHCRDSGRADCIGFADGTAVCICLQLENRKKHLGKPPLICYYKKYKSSTQKKCKKYKCAPGKKCINYAQFRNRPWRACQCQIGEMRGKNCDEEYLVDSPVKYPCVDTKSHGPLCMCTEYSRNTLGFCKPKVKQKTAPAKSKKYKSGSSSKWTSGSSSKEANRGSTSKHTGRMSSSTFHKKGKQSSTENTRHKMSQSSNGVKNSGVHRRGHSTYTNKVYGVGKGASVQKNVASAQKGNLIPTPHFIDPDWKKTHPCSSNPCKNNGTCMRDQKSSKNFKCACPLLFRGKICDQKMLQMDLKLSQKDKAAVGPIVAMVILVIVKLCCIVHCCRVSSKRKDLKNKYDKVVKKGEEPTAAVPGFITVSNDVAKTTFCCGKSSLPTSFAPKKSKKDKKKKKKEKDEKEEKDKATVDGTKKENETGKGAKEKNEKENKKGKGAKEKNRNENFPFLARRFGSQYRFSKHLRDKGQGDNKSRNNKSKYFLYTEKLNEKDNCRKDVKKSRHQFVKDYLKYHQTHYWSKRPKIRYQPKEKHVPYVSSPRYMPQVVESRQQLEILPFLDDTNLDRYRCENFEQKHQRSKSLYR